MVVRSYMLMSALFKKSKMKLIWNKARLQKSIITYEKGK